MVGFVCLLASGLFICGCEFWWGWWVTKIPQLVVSLLGVFVVRFLWLVFKLHLVIALVVLRVCSLCVCFWWLL